MDISFNSRQRSNDYYLAIAQAARYRLIRTADIVAFRHLKDPIIKHRFKQELIDFINENLDTIRKAKNDLECKSAISNINEECFNLEKQGTMLSLEKAKVFLTVRMERHQKEIGYTIEAINIVLGGAQVVSGAGILYKATTTIGKLAGTHVIFSGADIATENISKLMGDREAIGFMKNGYMGTAAFFGFDKKVGLIAYHSVDMGTSLYGIFKLTRKPDARRLYRYISSDFYRQVNNMSRAALTLKFISSGNKIRIISGIMNEDTH
ncbi:DUF4225 domain-containing protein [Enterobacillus tribolii]|uniref:Uncharacterized protein DUF4225 n=1 Tax=Enterobacillus tribolii TaxID=1487935 RepID=A0A370QTQ4_9GAMM|nr:DUF4225 domain-containing protein [Enterobacillus tribolii]MBW7981299.1 DUF4225 domain-containing protein [Enterobacillus tribolii]RDK92640.1 uncharacterized protein DUF4225 [Enterobacillus tribolii]